MMTSRKARAPLTEPRSNRPNTGRIDAAGADIIVGGVDTIVGGAVAAALYAGAIGGADVGGGAVVLSAGDGGSLLIGNSRSKHGVPLALKARGTPLPLLALGVVNAS
jgi:hypothetical protein